MTKMGAATVQPRVRLAPTATRYKNEEMLSGVIRWLCSCAAASCADAYEPFRRFSWLLRLRCNHPRSQPWNPSGRTSRRQPKKTRGEERETATHDTVAPPESTARLQELADTLWAPPYD